MQKALLLDRNYMALSLVPWQKAIILMVKGKAEAVQGSGTVREVRSTTENFLVPTIIRLLVVIPWRAHLGRMKFSRRNVAIRDNGSCQYCGDTLGKGAGTIDHIIPRSRYGKTDYLNCVLCCKSCNNHKADKTPVEAGMRLLKLPRKPTFLTMYRHLLENPPNEWCNYIIGLEA